MSAMKDISKGKKQGRGPTLGNKSGHLKGKKEPTMQRGGARAAGLQGEHVQGTQKFGNQRSLAWPACSEGIIAKNARHSSRLVVSMKEDRTCTAVAMAPDVW